MAVMALPAANLEPLLRCGHCGTLWVPSALGDGVFFDEEDGAPLYLCMDYDRCEARGELRVFLDRLSNSG